jgi:hypothetical protein
MPPSSSNDHNPESIIAGSVRLTKSSYLCSWNRQNVDDPPASFDVVSPSPGVFLDRCLLQGLIPPLSSSCHGVSTNAVSFAQIVPIPYPPVQLPDRRSEGNYLFRSSRVHLKRPLSTLEMRLDCSPRPYILREKNPSSQDATNSRWSVAVC